MHEGLRPRRWVKVSAMYNFTGGQDADGAVVTIADHKGDKVLVDVGFVDRHTGKAHEIARLTIHPDGMVTKR